MEIAVNQFSLGLNLDQHPLTTPNTTLTDALNATFLTKNGNELMLQNDMGNTMIQDARTGKLMGLSEGFIPLGMKEHGGVLYIASYNPKTNEGELGSIPSPNITYAINSPESKVYNSEIPLVIESTDKDLLEIESPLVKICDTPLKPGDAFFIELNLKRSVNQFRLEDVSYCKLVNGVVKDSIIEKGDNIYKYIFTSKDKGKGLYNIKLYAKTKEGKLLPINGIENKELLFYLNSGEEVKSPYWFIDKFKNFNYSSYYVNGILDLDMERSISADSLIKYPNYPSGYLYTTVELEKPNIEKMFQNKSTGLNQCFLHVEKETEGQEVKYKYHVCVPGFYCTSGIMPIDKISLEVWDKATNIKKEDCGEILRNNPNPTNNDAPKNIAGSIINSSFILVYDSNDQKRNTSIITSDEWAIENYLKIGSHFPKNNNENEDHVLFAFKISENELNKTFLLKFKFYSLIPNEYAEDTSGSMKWEGTDYKLVQEKTFTYTPFSVKGESISYAIADYITLEFPDENTPKLELKDTFFLYSKKNDEVYDYNGKEYGVYKQATMCTRYLYPFAKIFVKNNKIYGMNVAIGPMTQLHSSISDKGWGHTCSGRPDLDYRAAVISVTQDQKYIYSSGNENLTNRALLNYFNKKYLTNSLGLTINDFAKHGLFVSNMNWFKNSNQTPLFLTTQETTIGSTPYTKHIDSDISLKNLCFGGLDAKSNKEDTKNPKVNTLYPHNKGNSFFERLVIDSGSSIKYYTNDLQVQDATEGANKAMRNFLTYTYRPTDIGLGAGNVTYNCYMYPNRDPGNLPVQDAERRAGRNRYIEWIFCFMREFCPNAPIWVKGPQSNQEGKMKYFCDEDATTYTLIKDTTFKHNLTYFYKNPFKIDIINKSSSFYKYYNLTNNAIAAHNKRAFCTFNVTYATPFVENTISIETNDTNTGEFALDGLASNYSNTNTEYKYKLTITPSIIQESKRDGKNAKWHSNSSAMLALIPSYLFFINKDTLKIKQDKTTDRLINPYVYCTNISGLEYNQHLNNNKGLLINDTTCDYFWSFGNPDKITQRLPEGEYPPTWDLIEDNQGLLNGMDKLYKLDNGEVTITSPKSDDFKNKYHIIKIQGVASNFDPIKIKSVSVKWDNEETSDLPENVTLYDCFGIKIPNLVQSYTITISFDNSVLIKDIAGFQLNTSSYDDLLEENPDVFLFDKDSEHLTVYFPEYYVYCENGVNCANLFHLTRVIQFPKSIFSRIHGFYNIKPGSEDNYSGNSNSGDLHYNEVSDFTKDFYPTSNPFENFIINNITDHISTYKE